MEKKYNIIGTIILVILILLVGWLNHYLTQNNIDNSIEKRALSLEQKDCYTWQDIEVIVFGEIQE